MIVVDTHVIIWDALDPERLSTAAKRALTRADRDDGIVICEISLWEIAMLMKKKRLDVDAEYPTFIDLVLQSRNYFLQNLTPAIADASVNIDLGKNKDPADHIVAATAKVKGLSLITADQQIQNSDAVKTIW
ncbi:MAG: type II toxin-antitoxin system VapC family toxin [Verrucomicrobia bacterium]|nr:MAG: type II toxin-antitoxin system VapC family toxin [Verrucomicrobiota bacterium]